MWFPVVGVRPSVVRVVAYSKADAGDDDKDDAERGVGTGVVITDRGVILTNLHVVAGAKRVKVTFFDGLEADKAQLEEIAGAYGRREVTFAEYLAARKPIEARIDAAKSLLSKTHRSAALRRLVSLQPPTAQTFAELILFLKAEDLNQFKQSEFAFAGNVSATAIKAGAARTADTSKGVAVFVRSKGGLMAEASVGLGW